MKTKNLIIVAVIALIAWIWYRKKQAATGDTKSASLFGFGSGVYEGSLLNLGSLFNTSTPVVSSDTSTVDSTRRTTGTTDTTDSSTTTDSTVPNIILKPVLDPSVATFAWTKPKSAFPWRN